MLTENETARRILDLMRMGPRNLRYAVTRIAELEENLDTITAERNGIAKALAEGL